MIHKMLKISIAHIRKSTLNILNDDMNFEKFSCLETHLYGKGDYIVHINAKDFETYVRFNADMPYDLHAVVALAINSGCDTVCLSSTEKFPLFHLPRYEYVSRPDEMGDMANFEDCYCGGQLLRSVKLDEYGREITSGPELKQFRDYYGKKA